MSIDGIIVRIRVKKKKINPHKKREQFKNQSLTYSDWKALPVCKFQTQKTTK